MLNWTFQMINQMLKPTSQWQIKCSDCLLKRKPKTAIDKSNANEECQSTSVGGALRRNWVPLPLLSNLSEFLHTKWTGIKLQNIYVTLPMPWSTVHHYWQPDLPNNLRLNVLQIDGHLVGYKNLISVSHVIIASVPLISMVKSIFMFPK